MNEAQYEQQRANRRRRRPLRLDEVDARAQAGRSPLAAVVAKAARQLRRREEAIAAWGRVAPPEWQDQTAVEDVHGDLLVVTVGHPVQATALRRQQRGLERKLAAVARGLRRLRFVVGGLEQAGEAAE